MVKIAPSLLAADFAQLGKEVTETEAAGAEYLHLDVMDGVFVPNISFGFPVISSVRALTRMVFDVHMMVAAPERYLDAAMKSGADIVTVHAEACKDIPAFVASVHAGGCRAAVAVKPGTPVSALFPYLELPDMILIMTVEPGYGGQKLIQSTIGKVAELRAELTRRGLPTEIEVDGGVNPENAGELIAAGADILVAGSAVFRAEDRRAAIGALRR